MVHTIKGVDYRPKFYYSGKSQLYTDCRVNEVRVLGSQAWLLKANGTHLLGQRMITGPVVGRSWNYWNGPWSSLQKRLYCAVHHVHPRNIVISEHQKEVERLKHDGKIKMSILGFFYADMRCCLTMHRDDRMLFLSFWHSAQRRALFNFFSGCVLCSFG